MTRRDRALDGTETKADIYPGDDPSIPFSARFTFDAIEPPPKNKTNPSSSDSDRSGDGYEKLSDAGDYIWDGPASVKVTLRLTQDGSFSGLSVRSWGRNGVEGASGNGEDDDIVIK